MQWITFEIDKAEYAIRSAEEARDRYQAEIVILNEVIAEHQAHIAEVRGVLDKLGLATV